MKKILLTGVTAALFSIAAIAQEQAEDNIQEESHEFRQDAEETAEDIEEGAERTGEEIEEGAEETGETIEQGAEDFEQGARETGEDIEQGAERVGDEIEQSAEEAGDDMDQATDETLNEMNEEFESTVEDVDEQDQEETQGQRQQTSANFNTAPELEVVEGKEGPNNEVVYQYQDEYFYVDRKKKKLVKAEESQLQDAEHEVIVKDGQEDSEINTSSSNRDEDQK